MKYIIEMMSLQIPDYNNSAILVDPIYQTNQNRIQVKRSIQGKMRRDLGGSIICKVNILLADKSSDQFLIVFHRWIDYITNTDFNLERIFDSFLYTCLCLSFIKLQKVQFGLRFQLFKWDCFEDKQLHFSLMYQFKVVYLKWQQSMLTH